MYALEHLQQKSLKQLKEIGWQLNVLPASDRRCRQNWIDAIVGVNPPLLQLLEASPAGQKVEVPAKPIAPAAKTKKRTQKPIELALDEELPSEEEARSIVSQYFISTSLRKIRSAPPPARIFCPGERVRIIEVAAGSCNSQFCGSIGIVAQHNFYVSVWVELNGGGRKIVFCSPEELELIELVARESAAKQEPIEIQRQEPIENSPGVEVDRALSHKFLLCLKEGHNTLWYDGKNFVCEKWSAKTYCKRGVGSAKHQLRCHPEVKRLGNLQVVENSPADQKPIEVQATEPIEPAAKTSPGAEVDRVQHPIIEMVETFPAAEVEQAQEAIAPAAKNLPGSRLKTSTAHQLLELFKSSAHIIEDFPGVKTEVTVSESAIAPAAKISLAAESDRNPILTGIPLSDKFLARYSPPQPENIRFQSEADGQLSLLNFEVVTESEPPDPDDFETLDAFREAIARWDTENSELFAASIDSMCEWAPCPEEWYWSKAEILPLKPSSTSDQLLPLQQSSVMELSIADESSITCNFFIPTFDAWCDRFNRSDEPPDTGIYARLLKSKPPSFPPTALSQARVKRGLNAYQTHTKRIPKVSRTHTHCIVVGSSTQPARSPPGGDACLV